MKSGGSNTSIPTGVKSAESQRQEQDQGNQARCVFPGPSHLIQMPSTQEAKCVSLQALGTQKVYQRPTLVTLKMNQIKKKNDGSKK